MPVVSGKTFVFFGEFTCDLLRTYFVDLFVDADKKKKCFVGKCIAFSLKICVGRVGDRCVASVFSLKNFTGKTRLHRCRALISHDFLPPGKHAT